MSGSAARNRNSLTYDPGMSVLRYLDAGAARQGQGPEQGAPVSGGFVPAADTGGGVTAQMSAAGGAAGGSGGGGGAGGLLASLGSALLSPSSWKAATQLYESLFGAGTAAYAGSEAIASVIPLMGDAGAVEALLGQYGGVQGLSDAGMLWGPGTTYGPEAGAGALTGEAATPIAGDVGGLLAAELGGKFAFGPGVAGEFGAFGAGEGAGLLGSELGTLTAGAEAGGAAAGEGLGAAGAAAGYGASAFLAPAAVVAGGVLHNFMTNPSSSVALTGHPTVGGNYGAQMILGPDGFTTAGAGADNNSDNAGRTAQAQQYADYFGNSLESLARNRGYSFNPLQYGQGSILGGYNSFGNFYGNSLNIPHPEAVTPGSSAQMLSFGNDPNAPISSLGGMLGSGSYEALLGGAGTEGIRDSWGQSPGYWANQVMASNPFRPDMTAADQAAVGGFSAGDAMLNWGFNDMFNRGLFLAPGDTPDAWQTRTAAGRPTYDAQPGVVPSIDQWAGSSG